MNAQDTPRTAITASPEIPLKKPLPVRVLAVGQMPLEARGKYIQCGDGSRLGVTRVGSLVNLDKDRAFERSLRKRVGKKEARKILKSSAYLLSQGANRRMN